MKQVDCQLSITAMVECPVEDCSNIFDLFEMESLTDEGYLYKEILSSDGFGKINWGEIVKCPFCGHIFSIGDVVW